MSFAIFDEDFYLSSYPDVKAAVDARGFSSGLQHFQLYGLTEGRTLVSPIYNEASYLQTNPDVAAAVAAGTLRSGLQHYILYGEAAGRSGFAFDEAYYLNKYPDVAAAVADGIYFNSGLEHYIQYGRGEGRSTTPFNEKAYLTLYPDVAAAVAAGTLNSGLQHYIQYGQVDNRIGLLYGTKGNDIITGFGESITNIIGIDVVDYFINNAGGGVIISENFGAGEVDTLVGGEGVDLFALALGDALIPTVPQVFYDAAGSADYALIRNFERGSDAIRLAGLVIGNNIGYDLQAVDGNLYISRSGDLIGIVEGVTSLSLIPGSISSSGTFQIG